MVVPLGYVNMVLSFFFYNIWQQKFTKNHPVLKVKWLSPLRLCQHGLKFFFYNIWQQKFTNTIPYPSPLNED